MEYFEVITGVVSVVATVLAFLFKKKYSKWIGVGMDITQLAAHVLISLEDGEMDEEEKAIALAELTAFVEKIQAE